jgi:hypothetical protein
LLSWCEIGEVDVRGKSLALVPMTMTPMCPIPVLCGITFCFHSWSCVSRGKHCASQGEQRCHSGA